MLYSGVGIKTFKNNFQCVYSLGNIVNSDNFIVFLKEFADLTKSITCWFIYSKHNDNIIIIHWIYKTCRYSIFK